MIDLHSHTTYSDGTLSPQELIDLAIKRGITHLAITDHDSCNALDEAFKHAENKNITLIAGIEIEVEFQPGEFHLLGLALKNWTSSIAPAMKDVLQKRMERNLKLIEVMKHDGIPITLDEIKKEAPGEIIARPHFAAVMKKKGLVKSHQEAFDRYLAPGRPYYVKKEGLPLQDALELIQKAGGKSILAHPLSLYISMGNMKDTLKRWKDMGLDGIEAWHPGARLSQAARLTKMGEELGLLVTGGSDFHGLNRKDRQLGLGPGKLPLKEHLLEGLI